MRKIKYIILTVSVLFLFSSCEDFLTEPNPNAPDLLDAITNLNDTEKVLNGTYNSLFNHFVLSIEEDNFRTDIGSAKNRLIPNTGLAEQVEFYYKTYNSSTRRIDQRWGALYRGIFFANQTLFALDKIKGDLNSASETQKWNEQRAQALFFRGLYHFYAHSIFNEGKIIIRDAYEADVTKRSKKLATSEEVITFFRKDLEEALLYLPMPADVSEKGRITKGAATMILANSYLYEGTSDAITKATTLYESLRDDFGYNLETDMSKMFTTAGEFNEESIFEIAYTNDFGAELDEFDEKSPHNRLAARSAHFRFKGNDFIQPATWLVMAYENDPLDASNPVNTIQTGAGTMDTRRVSLRASAMLFLNDDLDTPVYNLPNALQSGGLGSRALIFSAFKKYTNHDLGTEDENAANKGNRLKSGKNVTINRLSEVLLNLAECYIKQGRVSEAISEINKIRNRWALEPLDIASQIDNPGVAYDNSSLMNRLMFIEKPLELSTEGHATRVIDLRRWGIASQRFQDLNSINYQGVLFPRPGRRAITPALARGSVTRITNNNLLSDVVIFTGILPDEATQTNMKIFQEFPQSSTNYSINNGYLPIPAEELISNEDI
ncbi:RagB/SusD family nutrient uptake outer membrane protein [Polaribacter sp. PL03]|uniref:RagB/SusD family nutrient uptake outer membrane protein n=1 Tax=Polaribacter sp. PL03 TaxID=3088353 RepID=UPI0029D0C8FC|nr:RagB/SusD family nutrient uptake outer membrane protein [Polaribacter sp. PL03]MDX6747934.1 RagB/SusD family nutrient uptake outer membrane protein [Polaribacter sp. PL03]